MELRSQISQRKNQPRSYYVEAGIIFLLSIFAPTASYSQDPESARLAVQAAREQEIQVLLEEGTALWRAKRGQEALERFEQALRLDSKNAEAHFSMGVIEESQGNYTEAESSYRQANHYAPDVPDYAKAVQDISKKLQSNKGQNVNSADKRRLTEEAAAAFKRGEYYSALDLYKQLDGKFPNQAATKHNIGTVYLLLKDHYNALEYFKQANKLDPKEARYSKAYKDLAAEIKSHSKEMKTESTAPLQVAPIARPTPPAQAKADILSQYGIVSGRSTNGEGVLMDRLMIGSRIAQAGLVPGDYIRAVEGTEINNVNQLRQVFLQYQPSQKLQMMIMHEGNLNVVMF
ncbi:MAG: tetratricopeptide repeat protein [Candidatus Obscuribacterales bacterium]|nr:tetratricopeptide repeat protein [Candidatus Obscuribacterales bacterium]